MTIRCPPIKQISIFFNIRMNVKDINDKLKNNFYYDYSNGKLFMLGSKRRDFEKIDPLKRRCSISKQNQSLNVQDINSYSNYSFKSKRIVNIMNPIYQYDITNTLI